MSLNLQHIIDRIPAQWGKWIQVAPGWHRIVLDLDDALAKLDPNYEVHQVKEKWGGLRYYCSLDTPEAIALIEAAEVKAAATCESCGAPGRLVHGSWMRTLCSKCIVHGGPK
jgi:hypothetical protein